MDRHRLDPTHALTPLAYPCRACGRHLRMLIVWPFWECPHCHVRLVPADLYPIVAAGQQPTAETPQEPAPQPEDPARTDSELRPD